MVDLGSGEWLDANRVQWDERVPLHLDSEFYDQSQLKSGAGRLTPIDEVELAVLFPDGVDGRRILHLQCHFGADTLVLAQRGATVVGVDFSKPAIVAARELAAEVNLSANSRFINANIYDLRHTLPEPESFDVVFTTWGTIGWLPDVAEWAKIIAWYLKPGGVLYFADGHPAAFMFDNDAAGEPVLAYPYDNDGSPIVLEEGSDYADEAATLQNTRTFEWTHPVSEIVTALLDAGLRIDSLHEHYSVPWKMFESLTKIGEGMFAWPESKRMPLGLSITASQA